MIDSKTEFWIYVVCFVLFIIAWGIKGEFPIKTKSQQIDDINKRVTLIEEQKSE